MEQNRRGNPQWAKKDDDLMVRLLPQDGVYDIRQRCRDDIPWSFVGKWDRKEKEEIISFLQKGGYKRVCWTEGRQWDDDVTGFYTKEEDGVWWKDDSSIFRYSDLATAPVPFEERHRSADTLPQKAASCAPGQETRPALPDVEKMRRYQAELEADKVAPYLSDQERQEHLAFLVQSVRQYQQAFPLETIKALSEGLKRLLRELQAKRQAEPSQDE